MPPVEETYVPHVGWLAHEAGDDVGRYLREGWFEFAEQALWWLYLRPGDCVIDCGAHVGLFSMLASQAVGEYGRVIALEPNPATAALLRKNVEDGGARNVEIVEAAAASRSGSLTLHAGAGKASAYSSSVANVEASTDLSVRAVTVDDLLRERSMESVALLKIDVEGAEADVWRGCAETAKGNGIAMTMVEFTEANQQAVGMTTRDLARAWEHSGYHVHRFNGKTLQLEPAAVEGPIEYENLFAAMNIVPINRRLREATAQRQRIARDVLVRGEACFEQMKRGRDVEHYRDLVAGLQSRLEQALQKAGELEESRQRMLAYATYINNMLNSKAGRVAQRLHLLHPPGWIETLKRDVEQAGSTTNAGK